MSILDSLTSKGARKVAAGIAMLSLPSAALPAELQTKEALPQEALAGSPPGAPSLNTPAFMERNLSVEEFLYPDDLSSFLMVGKWAIGAAPPEVVIASYVQEAHWSGDGKSLIAVRNSNYLAREDASTAFEKDPATRANLPALAEKSVVVWDRQSRKTTVAWKGGQRLSEVQCLPKCDAALATISQTTTHALPEGDKTETLYSILHVANGKANVIPVVVADWLPRIEVSPVSSLAILSGPQPNKDDERAYFQLIGIEPRLGDPVFLPPEIGWFDVKWSPEGDLLLCGFPRVVPEPNTDPAKADVEPGRWFRYANGGQLEELKEKPALFQSAEKPVLRVVAEESLLSGVKIHPLWLEADDSDGKKARVLIAPDSKKHALAPGNNGVFYTAEGSLFVRSLIMLPSDKVLAVQKEVERSLIQSRTREIGVGILMYAGDHNGELPNGDEDFRTQVKMYTPVNGAALDGFVYTFPGGSQASIEAPADTQLGYTPGPDGYAVLYADSHVKWVKELPVKP